MRIATWNVNSIRAREERLLRWLEAWAPDVLCLQELKVADSEFPSGRLREAGWQTAAFGQKTYNGVAILSRQPIEEVETGLGDGVDDPQARLIAARVGGVRVASAYVPNGQQVGSDKWAYKLAWLARLAAWVERRRVTGEPFALCGDFNVAPDDRDVARPEEWRHSVLCHEEARRAFSRLLDLGLVDVFRKHHPEGGIYSWWDYRELAFPKGNGLRIDHILASPSLAGRSTAAEIDRNERKGNLPSDHAPVVVTFA